MKHMFLGHYAIALAAKKPAPAVALGTMILAAQLVDLLWPVLLVAGLEEVAIVPGITAVSPLDFTRYPYTHSLLAALGWGVLFGAVYFLFRRDGRGAWVAGAAVLSHWLLDLVVHRPDLPLYPDGAPRVVAVAATESAAYSRGAPWNPRRASHQRATSSRRGSP
ncbi:MAG: hypothetical protein QN203_06455 [Armatimonadota bacterium]|nr:hypothetical protein [Armatimonadota bacterium]MDR7485791.1 hypothetical protein [Armatimonadota bacterium]